MPKIHMGLVKTINLIWEYEKVFEVVRETKLDSSLLNELNLNNFFFVGLVKEVKLKQYDIQREPSSFRSDSSKYILFSI